MPMPAGQKVFIYILGVLLGILILKVIPRNETSDEPHPWHAQTAVEGSYPMAIVDDLGREMTLTRQPRWMVSLAPSITEMLFAMEMGDHLTAVTAWDEYPAKAKLLRDSGGNLGSMDALDVAMIKDLRPQLVFATGHTPKAILEAISNPPATVVVSLEHKTIAGIYEDIGNIGRITGVPGRALHLINALSEKETFLTDRFNAASVGQRKTVLLLFSLEDDLSSGGTMGGGTWLDEVIEKAQGRNIASEHVEHFGTLPLETIREENPDCILIMKPNGSEKRAQLENQVERLATQSGWSELDAVRGGEVFWVEAGPFQVPGPRFVEAIQTVGEALWD